MFGTGTMAEERRLAEDRLRGDERRLGRAGLRPPGDVPDHPAPPQPAGARGLDPQQRAGNLTIQPTADRHGQYFGVPYGSKARLILLFLQTEAVKSASRQIELGQSMRAWRRRGWGGDRRQEPGRGPRPGQTDRAVADLGLVRAGLGRGELAGHDRPRQLPGRQGRRDPGRRDLRELLPGDQGPSGAGLEAAIRALGEQSLAIDLYLWLAYRLHVLDRPVALSWAALHAQFGGGVQQVKHWKPRLRNLAAAMAAYPAAKAEVTKQGSPAPLAGTDRARASAERRWLGAGRQVSHATATASRPPVPRTVAKYHTPLTPRRSDAGGSGRGRQRTLRAGTMPSSQRSDGSRTRR